VIQQEIVKPLDGSSNPKLLPPLVALPFCNNFACCEFLRDIPCALGSFRIGIFSDDAGQSSLCVVKTSEIGICPWSNQSVALVAIVGFAAAVLPWIFVGAPCLGFCSGCPVQNVSFFTPFDYWIQAQIERAKFINVMRCRMFFVATLLNNPVIFNKWIFLMLTRPESSHKYQAHIKFNLHGMSPSSMATGIPWFAKARAPMLLVSALFASFEGEEAAKTKPSARNKCPLTIAVPFETALKVHPTNNWNGRCEPRLSALFGSSTKMN